MSKTNSGLVAYAKAQVGLPYRYGTFGQTASASLYKSKKTQYPSMYNGFTESSFTSQYGKRVHDCVGLVKGYLWSSSTTAAPVYASSQDVSASGMYSKATTKGGISSFPMKAGQLVFKSSSSSASGIHHVGVFGGDGYVYEAKGHQYGVVKTTYAAKDWQYWAQCPWCTDNTASTSSTSTTSSTSATSKTATSVAKSKDSSLAGTYKVTASLLNMRNGAGTSYSIMTTLSKNTKVKNYGYYTENSGTKWLYVQFVKNGATDTGVLVRSGWGKGATFVLRLRGNCGFLKQIQVLKSKLEK